MRMPSRVRVITAALAFSMALAATTAVAQESADDAREKREEVRQEKAKALRELQAARLADEEIADLLEFLAADIAATQLEVAATRQDLSAALDAIARAEAQIAAADAQVEGLQGEIATLAVASFVLTTKKEETFFAAGSLTEAYRQESLLKNANSEPVELLEQLRIVREDRAVAEAQVVSGAQESIDLEAKLASKLGELQAEQEASLELKAELERRIGQWGSLVAQRNKEEAELTKFILENDPQLTVPNAPIPKVGEPSVQGFNWPVIGKVTSVFGPRRHPIFKTVRAHNGLDITGRTGDPIVAAKDGVVLSAGWRGGYGNAVVVSHGEGISTLYAHQSKMAVKEGDQVLRGELIGYVGSTGWSTGPHLHFEIRLNGKAIDPMPYMP